MIEGQHGLVGNVVGEPVIGRGQGFIGHNLLLDKTIAPVGAMVF
jgi:hypothetical protein